MKSAGQDISSKNQGNKEIQFSSKRINALKRYTHDASSTTENKGSSLKRCTTRVEDKETAHHKENKKQLILGILLIASALLLTSGWSLYNNIKREHAREELDYAILCPENYNIEDYQNFITKYKNSEHLRQVTQRLNQLKQLASDWDQIKSSTNSNKFVDFMNIYSDPYYSSLCRIKIDSLDWVSAKTINTPESYQKYISTHPEGMFMPEAIIARSEVGYMSLNENEITDIFNTCQEFFNILSTDNYESIYSYLAPNAIRFFNIEIPMSDDIKKWTEKNREFHFLSYIVQKNQKCQKNINEENQISYVSTFNIERVTTNDIGEEQISPFSVSITFNDQLKIYSIETVNI